MTKSQDKAHDAIEEMAQELSAIPELMATIEGARFQVAEALALILGLPMEIKRMIPIDIIDLLNAGICTLEEAQDE